jgi:uncharacterized protein (DUF3084 family)
MDDGVIIALIGAAGTVGAAGLGVLGVLVQRLRRAVGNPGDERGDLVHMAERILAGQARQDRRLARLEERSARHENRLARVEAHVYPGAPS